MNHRKPRACCRCRLLSWRPMTLHLHRAERTDLLADGLGALLSDPLPDPFAEELVIVPAQGRRAMAQPAALARPRPRRRRRRRLRRHRVPVSPRSLIAEITGTVDDDPWAPDAMVWPLLDVIDASLDEPWCRTLATPPRPLRAGRGGGAAAGPALRGRAPARRTVRVLRRGSGRSCSSTGSTARHRRRRSTPTSLAARALARAGRPRRTPTRRTSGMRKPLRGCRNRRLDLPARLSLFGHTRLPVTEIELLDALGHPPRPPSVAAPSQRPRSGSPSPDVHGPVPAPRRHQPPHGRPSAARHPRP